MTVSPAAAPWLAFDHGPLGFLSIAAHGHADALALWLHLDGEPVLVDSGTYLYSGGGAIREALRATASHNALTIDGASQSATAGPFNWRDKGPDAAGAPGRAARWSISASHDGYRRTLRLPPRTVSRPHGRRASRCRIA